MKCTLSHVTLTLALIFTLASIPGCKSNPTEPDSQKITTGASVEVTTQSMPPSGGTITVSKPGDSINGLTIEVPNGAYPEARSFHISYAPITSHQFGSDFNVLTPLITIENGGGYADSLMVLRIPVKIPKGEFAMAFLYDRVSGKLEGMPLLEADSDHVTVMTANFDHASVASLGKRSFTSAIADGNGSSQIVVASTPETALNADATTGFDPHVDSWQIPDTATYITPEGMSPGESFSAIWYYVIRKKKLAQSSLFGRYDNDGVRKTPTLWQDDAGAIKLCAKLSVGLFPYLHRSLESYRDAAQSFPNWHQGRSIVQQLAYSMKKSGDPQMLIIAGPTKQRMVIAYQVLNGNLVKISDPALPGISTTLEYDMATDRFKPYTNLGTFTEVYYEGVSSVADWKVPVDDFKQLDAGAIGNGSFPNYSLMTRDSTGNDVPLTDGFKVNGSQLTLSVKGVGFSGEFEVYNEQGTTIATSGSDISLPSGQQRIGIHVMDDKFNWVDFRWLTMNVDDSENPNHGPTFGPISMTISVDGGTYQCDTDSFVRMEVSGLHLPVSQRTFTLVSTCDSIRDPFGDLYDLRLLLSVRAFDSVGVYTDFVESSTEVETFSDIWHLSQPRKLTVSEWTKGKCSGSFEVGFKTSTGEEVPMSGTFHYPK